MLGFPAESFSSFLSEDSFQQETESFLAQAGYFWLESFGSSAFSIFLMKTLLHVLFFFFFFPLKTDTLCQSKKRNCFFRQPYSPFFSPCKNYFNETFSTRPVLRLLTSYSFSQCTGWWDVNPTRGSGGGTGAAVLGSEEPEGRGAGGPSHFHTSLNTQHPSRTPAPAASCLPRAAAPCPPVPSGYVS